MNSDENFASEQVSSLNQNKSVQNHGPGGVSAGYINGQETIEILDELREEIIRECKDLYAE